MTLLSIAAAHRRSGLRLSALVRRNVIAGIAPFAESLIVGPGLGPSTKLGPFISEQRLERVLDYIASGSADGAEVVAGGTKLEGKGFFVAPTIPRNSTAEIPNVREEIFGPALSMSAFDDADSLAEILRRANDTDCGLNSIIFTQDISRALGFAQRIQAGNILVKTGAGMDPNMPFGGF